MRVPCGMEVTLDGRQPAGLEVLALAGAGGLPVVRVPIMPAPSLGRRSCWCYCKCCVHRFGAAIYGGGCLFARRAAGAGLSSW